MQITGKYPFRRRLCLAVFCFYLVAPNAGAEDVETQGSAIHREPTGTVRTITLPHSVDYPPLFYVDDKGESQGILVDYWKLWSDKTGIPVKFEAYLWHECIERVRTGQADIIPGIFYTAKRDAFLDFSQAFMEVKTTLFMRRGIGAEGLPDLDGHTIGVTRGDRAESYLANQWPGLELRAYDGFEAVVRAAAAGEIDAFVMDYPCAQFYLHELHIYNDFEALQTLFVGKFCAAVKEGNQELLILLNRGIEQINEEEIRDIVATWMPAQQFLPAWVIRAILIGVGVLVALMIVWHIVMLRIRVHRRTCLLHAARKNYQMLIENATDGIGVYQDNRYSFVSPSMAKITGYSAQELTSRDRIEFVHPDDHRQAKERDEKFRRGEDVPSTYSVRIVTRTGETKWLQVSSTRIDWEGKPAELDFIADVSALKRAEQALKKAGEQVRAIVEVSPVPLIITRPEDGRILYANDHLGNLVGYDKEELIGQLSPDFYYDPNDRKKVLEILGRDGKISDYEVRLKKRDGSVIWTIFSLAITEIGGEKVIMGGIYDISERKQTEAALQKERDFVSTILETAGALIIVLKPDGCIIRFNAACERISGYKFDEVRDKLFWDIFILPEEAKTVEERFEEILQSHSKVEGENHWITKDGSKRLIAWSNTVLRDDAGAVEYVVAIGIDITERKEAEEKLRLYRKIFENSNDGIVLLDSQGRYLESNPRHREFIGYSSEELYGRRMDSILSPTVDEDLGEVTCEPDGSCRHEFTVRKKDSSEIIVDVSAFAIRDEERRITNYAGIGRDVTEQRRARDALAKRAHYEEGLAECSRALLEESDRDTALNKALGHLLKASQASRVYIFENFEDKKDGLCMRQTHEVCADGIEPQIDDELLQHAPYGWGFDRWRKTLSKGEAIVGAIAAFPEFERKILAEQDVVSILVLPITVEGKWYGFIGFDDCEREREGSEEDIRLLRTASEMLGAYIESKRFEEALRVSEERFRSLVENATDIIFSLTPEGRFSYLSPQFAKATGYEVSEVIGKLVYEGMHPDDQEDSRQWFEAGMPQDDRPATGYQFRMQAKDGSWRWFVSNSSIIRDDKGTVIEAIGVAHDITEMKKVLEDLEKANRNLRDTQAQLAQSEKMASLGMLVAGVAHEINTPVGAINSMHNTQMRAVERLRSAVERSSVDDSDFRATMLKYLKVVEDAGKVIESGSDRVTNIVRRLRSFARLDEAELKKCDIHEGLEDTLTLIHHEIKHDITVHRNYGDIPRITCFPGQLNQVFLNILINAKQAIKGKGEITISTFMMNDNLHIVIEDTGIGISKESLAKIFDPGFTTKGVGVGTGLGLSICYQIVQDHKGEITAESEPGQGTKFTIILPTDLESELGNSAAPPA